MNPDKVDRERLCCLTDLPNVGEAIAADLRLLGVADPTGLRGRDPLELYDELCRLTGLRHDPCVLDIFLSVADFLAGAAPRRWWEFTELRKRMLAERSA